MKHLPSLGFLVVMFASCRLGFSLGTWKNCTTDTCKTFFTSRICDTGSSCQCGMSTNQSTCIEPSVIANQIGVSINTSEGHLNCCMCEPNNTFCCDTCQLSTTQATTTTATSTTAAPTTAAPTTPQTTTLPVVKKAILIVVFILDINKYSSSSTTMLYLPFRYAIGNLTNTDNSLTKVTEITFATGVHPNCGFKVESYVTESDPQISSNSKTCSSMIINATMRQESSSSLSFPNTIKLIQDSVKNGTFRVTLSDGSQIQASFMLSARSNSSYELHRGQYNPEETSTSPLTNDVAPIHTNLWPLIYSAIGVFSLIALCIIWQCAKQSYLLRRKKFTDINSNRVNTRKRKIQEAMSNQASSEKDTKTQRGQFDMTHSKMQLVDNEALTRQYDWTTPSYVPNMLAPAYTPTELHGQHSPPRLMLDDEDSDSDKKSIGRASVINVDEESDEDLREILESEEEDDVFHERTSTRQSYASRKKSVSTSNKRKASTISKTSKKSNSPRNMSANSTAKIPNPAIGQVRKCSYSGPEGRERTPSLGFGILKANRITPVDGDRRPSASSIKPQKKGNSTC